MTHLTTLRKKWMLSGHYPDTSLAIGWNSNANSGRWSNGSDTQQAIDQDSNAISGGGSNAISDGQSAANASGLAALEGRDPPASTTPRTVVIYGRYVRDALGSYRERYDETDSRQRAIYLQSLLEEDSGDRPPAQRSIDDQQLIDGLERQIFTKQGECSTLESETKAITN
jgi:hypothetical protein